MLDNKLTHSGYVAIIGRPNVGKSTLLNEILGKRLSITSRKPQTTRHKILGVKTLDNFQTIYVDTPGLHDNNKKLLNKYMNQNALSVLVDSGINAIIFVVAGTVWNKEDEAVLQTLKGINIPVIAVVNKMDLVDGNDKLLDHIKFISKLFDFKAIIPMSAEKKINVSSLENEVRKLLPEGPFYFPAEQLTDRNNSFLVSEVIREKLTRFLGQELPYVLAVSVEEIKLKDKTIHITATIYVERAGQKVIILGKDGSVLKKIGTLSRKDLEELLGKKVFLRLWVKIKTGWTDNKILLEQFGYVEH